MRDVKGKQKGSKASGQSLMEFALLLPILLLLVLGAMDFGRLFYTKIVITNAAREGANFLAYFPDNKEGALVAIAAEADSSTVVIDVNDDVSISPETLVQGLPVEVTITKKVDLIFDGILQFLGLIDGQIELSSTVRMRVQY